MGGSCRDTGPVWDLRFSVDQLAQDSAEVVCTLLAWGHGGTGRVVPARVAGLLIGLDHFDRAAVYGGLWIF